MAAYKAPSAGKTVQYANPQAASQEQSKRRNEERNLKWNNHFDWVSVQFPLMDLRTAKRYYKTLVENFTNSPTDRMTAETKAKYFHLRLNLAAFIEHMEEGIESLKKQNVYVVAKIVDFEFRKNYLFAAAFVKVRWKTTVLHPDVEDEWLPYYNLQCGDLLNKFIEDPLQENHWIRAAIAGTPLLIKGTRTREASDVNSGIRFEPFISPANLGTTIFGDNEEEEDLESGKIQ